MSAAAHMIGLSSLGVRLCQSQSNAAGMTVSPTLPGVNAPENKIAGPVQMLSRFFRHSSSPPSFRLDVGCSQPGDSVDELNRNWLGEWKLNRPFSQLVPP